MSSDQNKKPTTNAPGSDGTEIPLPSSSGTFEVSDERQVPLSAEGGVYERDNVNEPKLGTAGKDGISIGKDGKPGSKV
ncbi:hypothetical protein AAL_07898 [Moelleriella libera RCEF 2490]|uniref:Uncharacterized protein n=1 Tax=Moelleriella libera RCEF 2490 TaxID=1081109 RepID=A0A167WK65_9HYPO|nr:hypothetical protein AAL_07898 [Moelleriella libera RCEF 2490]